MKGTVIATVIIALIIGVAVFGISSAMNSNAIVFDAPLTLDVKKTWVDKEQDHTYYLVSGYVHGTNQTKVIEIESPLGNWFASNPDTDFGKIFEGNTYHFKCTGYEIQLTRDNLVCKLD